MADKDSEKKQWTDPKDYGLPFVEITPIRAVPQTTPEKVKKEISATEIQEEVILPQTAKATPVSTSPEVKLEKKPSQPISSKPIESKKSSAWVWAVVLIGLGLISIIVWQIQSQADEFIPNEIEAVEEKSEVITPAEPEQNPVDSTATGQNQPAVNQDTIQAISDSNLNISKPTETGTTIAQNVSGNVIRVESKAERPQYFIIVGSLPNEKLAIEEANILLAKSKEVYLISPYEGSKNYRLALGKYNSFKVASEELEKIKSSYTEALWILKY